MAVRSRPENRPYGARDADPYRNTPGGVLSRRGRISAPYAISPAGCHRKVALATRGKYMRRTRCQNFKMEVQELNFKLMDSKLEFWE